MAARAPPLLVCAWAVVSGQLRCGYSFDFLFMVFPHGGCPFGIIQNRAQPVTARSVCSHRVLFYFSASSVTAATACSSSGIIASSGRQSSSVSPRLITFSTMQLSWLAST